MHDRIAPEQVDAAITRRLAVEADADPRSVTKRLRGGTLKGLAQHRIDRVLRAHGLEPGCLLLKEAS
jgi:hypothetical protein